MMLVAGITTAVAVVAVIFAIAYRLFSGRPPKVDGSFSSGSFNSGVALQWVVLVVMPLLIVLAVLARRIIDGKAVRQQRKALWRIRSKKPGANKFTGVPGEE